MKICKHVSCIVFVMLMLGCGQKGNLVLPDQETANAGVAQEAVLAERL